MSPCQASPGLESLLPHWYSAPAWNMSYLNTYLTESCRRTSSVLPMPPVIAEQRDVTAEGERTPRLGTQARPGLAVEELAGAAAVTGRFLFGQRDAVVVDQRLRRVGELAGLRVEAHFAVEHEGQVVIDRFFS